MSTSDLWKITTKEAGDSFDPPDDMKSMVADIEAAAAGAPRLFATYADLMAFANPFEGMGARVTSDPTASNNGDYVWSGSAWVRRLDDTGYVTSGIFTPDARYTVQSYWFRRIGSTVRFFVSYTNVDAKNNGGNAYLLGAVDSGWAPKHPHGGFGGGHDSIMTNGYISGTSLGVVYFPGAGTIAAGSTGSLSGAYYVD